MKQKIKPLKIGNLKINPPLILAPMVDITNLPYRLICRKSGARLAYTEMLYIDAIVHKNKKTEELMLTNKDDKPIGIQITGNDINLFKQSIPFLKKFDFVDLNCGCPSEKITGNKAGSYLLNNPEKISQIIKLLKSHNLIVTAKIRLGYNKNNVLKIAKTIEKAGADAITIHPRLAIQGYDVPADLSQIKKVKSALSIPIIGNGDVFSGKDALEMLKICDGVMIARGAIGDPLIFKRITHYLKTGKEIPSSFKDNIKLFQEYLKLSKQYKITDLSRVKHLGCKFIRNIQGSAKLRNQLMHLSSIEEIENFVSNLQR